MKKKMTQNYIKTAWAVLCLFVLFTSMIYSTPAETAFAEETYSAVLADLHKDSRFDEANYPAKADDYSLQVITLGESEKQELFVYVYQPAAKTKPLPATSINISTTINDAISFKNYKLTLLNGNGVFAKYLVNDFTVKEDKARYYVISSIYRKFDESIDEQASGGNVITEVENDVSKQYTFGEINGKPFVEVVEIETIVITDKYVGFCRYEDGYKLFGFSGAGDSHFVAFDTNRDIEKLLEADVYYTAQSYSYMKNNLTGKETKTFGDVQENYAYLKCDQMGEYDGGGLFFGGPYTWKRIQTVDEFIKTETRDNTIYGGALINVSVATKLTESGLENIKNKKWVLRFAETECSSTNGGTGGYTNANITIVGDVTILRLKFETDGVTYNMGVIDNKQSGDWTTPDNETSVVVKPGWLPEKAKDIAKLIALIILIVIVILLIWLSVKFLGWIWRKRS